MGSQTSTRHLDWSDLRNARDLGGIPAGRGTTRYGVFVRADTLIRLDQAGREALLDYRVSLVVDLQTSTQHLEKPHPFVSADSPVRCLNLPLFEDDLLEVFRTAPSFLDGYLAMLETRQPAIAQIVTALAEHNGTALFHCFAGKDRTGVVTTLILDLCGVAEDEIAAEFVKSEVRLATMYEIWLAEAEPELREQVAKGFDCRPEWMPAVLSHIRRRWGGVEPYLVAGGTSHGSIQRLRDKLV